MNSKVVLVDLKDNQIGTMDKMDAHVNGVLHRAFSVLIFNDKGEILLQQRALHKYHSGGLWTNTCCSHPFPGEEIIEAGKRRLFEEMGFKCDLTSIGNFTYQCEFGNGLIEHEFDHVLKGFYNNDPVINIDEVESFKWVAVDDLKKDILIYPQRYTFWFLELLKRNFI